MIVGVNKIKDLEFSFPIKNAPKAINDTAKIEVSKVAVSTPENFFKSLKEIAELIQFIV